PLPPGGPVRLHGWRRAPDAPLGVALVATEDGRRAALAVTPGPPTRLDVVVTPGPPVRASLGAAPWQASAELQANDTWNAEIVRGVPSAVPAGTARLELRRDQRVELGAAGGPGVSADSVRARLTAGSGAPVAFTLAFESFRAALLPDALAKLLGAGGDRATPPTRLALTADAGGGLRFDDGGLRVELPGQLRLPAVTVRGFAVELGEHAEGLALRTSLGLKGALPGVPVTAQIDGLKLDVPFALTPQALGPLTDAIRTAPLPDAIGIELALPPVSGGGAVLKTPSGGYAGVLDVDLGSFGVQAAGVLDLPDGTRPTSLLALLSATFPYPGIQLGFGFALDAVGGLVGINRRADVGQLRQLVSDGNADRILFPTNAVSRAQEITRSLASAFPAARGRFVIGPMVRVNWGGRLATLSGAVVLDLPAPAQVLLLGRLLVAVPDPALPLIRLQASVFGKIDPAVPETEVLVSLAGSYVVTVPVSGELYLLARGGDRPLFVLSAGGFHPRYVRPPGVPELRRLTMDLGGGFLGLRAEAYLAVTSNAVMFGAKLQLDATIAGCGVEGHLGLDALFVYEPTFSFTVSVSASVAVRAFGRRLASVGLAFTLEGPAPWHAFGTGTISVLFWDVSLDFDVRWGDAPRAVLEARDVRPLLERALADPAAWTVERQGDQRSPVRLTDAAKADLAAGRVAGADAILRVSQRIVPLGREITRFARARVPKQQWDVTGGTGGEVRERFVPAEFFDMRTEEQLTAPAFVEAKSGVLLSDRDVVLGAGHLVDDGYETRYEVEDDFQTAPPGPTLHPAIARFALERYACVVAPDERLALWRAAQRPLTSRKVAMVA
ncbi:MAG TPA: DUF6603 domain-containing protein, partial [Conexibacter sp.]|nr:DUF6603 domain-containing protein [Conexibacter sp.]